jgi:hypothetical protein
MRPALRSGFDLGLTEVAMCSFLWLPAADSASSSRRQPHPRLTDEQFPLGLLPWTGYRSQSVFAKPDGMPEVAGKDGVEFGTDGLERLVMANAASSLGSLAQRILAAVKRKDAMKTIRPCF